MMRGRRVEKDMKGGVKEVGNSRNDKYQKQVCGLLTTKNIAIRLSL
jgi:hypothetical protein